MSMTSHLKQKGLVPHQECSTPPSSDPILPFRLMRIISEMLHHYWKDLLINRHFMKLTFHNGLPIRIGITFSPHMDEAYENLVKEFYANAIVEGEEIKCWVRRKSFSVSPTYLAEILHINRPMLKNSPVYDDLCPDKDYLGMVLDKTWNSHPMETQLAFPLFLWNWECLQ